ncbi:hypothetical protein FACS1894195_1810 [Bacteroidia bacterium]|nr:hypothetical protein FACS1894195_1810 [Bacteroidia bacterium]
METKETSTKPSSKRVNKRAIVSIALFALIILLVVSAMLLSHVREDYPDAFMTKFWAELHGALGALFAIITIFHVIFNWKAMRRYLTGQN